jgi:hypothetical protein
MKRCPQCEFIYEDDQSLCDMDGVLLVFDSRTLPNMHALATVEVPVPARALWRHRTFPAMAALILATVLSLVYFVSTQPSRPVIAPLPAGMPTPLNRAPLTPQPNVAASTSDANQTPASSAASELNAGATATKPETKSDPAKAAAPAAKKASAKSSPIITQAKPDEPKKEDSKVGSILKKTGRLLKKPFKL